MGGRLIEVELRVADVDRALRFYRELIGVPFEEPETHPGEDVRHAHAVWGTWRAGEGFLMLNLYPLLPGEVSRTRIGLVVEDLDAVHGRLEREGIAVVRAPEAQPWGRSAVYRDPDGNIVSLTERAR